MFSLEDYFCSRRWLLHTGDGHYYCTAFDLNGNGEGDPYAGMLVEDEGNGIGCGEMVHFPPRQHGNGSGQGEV